VLDVSLHIRGELWQEQDGAPHHFGGQVTNFTITIFKTARLGGRLQLLGHQGHVT